MRIRICMCDLQYISTGLISRTTQSVEVKLMDITDTIF